MHAAIVCVLWGHTRCRMHAHAQIVFVSHVYVIATCKTQLQHCYKLECEPCADGEAIFPPPTPYTHIDVDYYIIHSIVLGITDKHAQGGGFYVITYRDLTLMVLNVTGL